MRLTHNTPRSRWVRSSFLYGIMGLVAGALVIGLRFMTGPWPSLLWALVAIPVLFWIILRATLYPHVYRGKALAMTGLVLAFLGFSDAVGRLSYQGLWRRAFRLTGTDALFENPKEGWRIRHPRLWTAYSLKTGNVSTYFFKPAKSTPGIEFSITHRTTPLATNIDAAVESFLLDLPKSGQTQILRQGPVRYPKFQRAHEVVYEDPTPFIRLRHRLIFLSGAEGLTVLSVTAVPHWFDRLAEDANHFLFSFEPLI